MKIDLKDRKLLYWLDQDSRSTNKALGKKVGLTEQAIGYRLKRLQHEGVIKRFVAFINTLSLGYSHYKVFVKLRSASERREERFMRSLIRNPNIRWVVSTSGRYDVSFSILAQTPADFTRIYGGIESEFGEFISEKNVSLVVSSPGFTRDFLVGGGESKMLTYSASEKPEELDETDRRILRAISQDARKSTLEIAHETGSTADIVKYRMKKLRERHVINGFTVQLDLEKISYEYYSVFLFTHNLREETEKEMLSFVLSHPNILFFVKVIGNYDFQLELEVKDYSELERVLKEFRTRFSGNIRDFEILRVTKEYKYDFYPF